MKFRKKISVSTALGLAPAMLVGLTATGASAHGSNEFPASRIYNCWHEQTKGGQLDEGCKQFIAKDPQALSEWQSVKHGDANRKHHAAVPDGYLASAKSDNYNIQQHLDDHGIPWKSTDLSQLYQNGNEIEFKWSASASHTGHISYYISKPGAVEKADKENRDVNWEDLQDIPFLVAYTHDDRSGATDDTGTGLGALYTNKAKLPNNLPHGKYVVYAVWERMLPGDSPSPLIDKEHQIFGNNGTGESFYSYSDVTL
ncbi:lytic polysaccharide monooxygenase [Streptomyces sp. AV19]|uniref:lytic polysaccharide monooxygenase n=1 Tax=Streptomyces sp. AV19 TaxID=2793068 RepID=UPI0018FE260C|nr:lytic polysaccharide monooxygenase [Streptomyces sp. AV19]MBH1937181.1 lytic polysaccharide monooxygenase [Streptomyces sp. AV19]MDG4536953.1 lytic polysaccharide monooxygenase [Streptomyces sp. AV19]